MYGPLFFQTRDDIEGPSTNYEFHHRHLIFKKDPGFTTVSGPYVHIPHTVCKNYKLSYDPETGYRSFVLE